MTLAGKACVVTGATSGIGRALAIAGTRSGARGFADSLRQEINADGVRVLTDFPGRTVTPMQESVHEHEGRPHSAEQLMDPEDVAELLVAVLCADPSMEDTDLMLRRPLAKVPEIAR